MWLKHVIATCLASIVLADHLSSVQERSRRRKQIEEQFENGLFPELRNLAKTAQISATKTCGASTYINSTRGEYYCKLTEHVEKLRRYGLLQQAELTRKRRNYHKKRDLEAVVADFDLEDLEEFGDFQDTEEFNIDEALENENIESDDFENVDISSETQKQLMTMINYEEEIEEEVSHQKSKSSIGSSLGTSYDLKTDYPEQCSYCRGGEHEILNAIDGQETWWQSPTIATENLDPEGDSESGHEIDVQLDLRSTFQVAYIIIKAANSPRPGDWVLEKSLDGENWQPWQMFATDGTRCRKLTTEYRRLGFTQVVQYGRESINQQNKPDDSVHCTTRWSTLVDQQGDQLENGEIIIRLINGRQSQSWPSNQLLDFLTARYIRLRLLKIRTLMADLMSMKGDQRVFRRYYYSIKDISVGGMCICNGHATSCNVKGLAEYGNEVTSACECQHNTGGPSCERCLDSHHQYNWRAGTSDPTADGNSTRYCERCNCNDQTDNCEYKEWANRYKMSTDIYGHQRGGGVCFDCNGNTRGVNCQSCQFDYFRAPAADLSTGCSRCECNAQGSIPSRVKDSILTKLEGEHAIYNSDKNHILVDASSEDLESGEFELFYTCKHDFNAENEFQCKCREGYAGGQCSQCAEGWRRDIDGDANSECVKCKCDTTGTEGNPCDYPCSCKTGVIGDNCGTCAPGYFNFDHDSKPCLECYCSGRTNECEKSRNYQPEFSVGHENGWKITEPIYQNMSFQDIKDTITIARLPENVEYEDHSDRYWIPVNMQSFAQIKKKEIDLCGLYGAYVRYDIVNASAINDVGQVAIYSESAAVFSDSVEFSYDIQLVESNFGINRVDFMEILCNMRFVLVKATHGDSGEQININSLNLQFSDEHHGNVETCYCPTGYTGNSCEFCEANYFRGSDGSCRVCDCNFHSAGNHLEQECNPSNGDCYSCDPASYTTGKNCELCVEQFFGNPRNQTSCETCVCPNIEGDCHNLGDDYECISCPDHQEGLHCERCAVGYWKNENTQEPDSNVVCEQCNCNGKSIDCAEDTGVCTSCQRNSDGFHCETCLDGFYKDEAGECVECQCHSTGSHSIEDHPCDKKTGECKCKSQHANELDCSDCAPGFYLCEELGCCPCDCRSSAGPCNSSTGACDCNPGVAGEKCDSCHVGYFQFDDSTGCKQCECNSFQKACDPTTGVCICPPNTQGDQCGLCTRGSYNNNATDIQESGCQFCECNREGTLTGSDCDPANGHCECAAGYQGRRCDDCQHGYFKKDGKCEKCQCTFAGTASSNCDDNKNCGCNSDGTCDCRKNVQGDKCDTCKPGTFGLHERNTIHGCMECCCGGHANNSTLGCQKAQYYFADFAKGFVDSNPIRVQKHEQAIFDQYMIREIDTDLSLSYGGDVTLVVQGGNTDATILSAGDDIDETFKLRIIDGQGKVVIESELKDAVKRPENPTTPDKKPVVNTFVTKLDETNWKKGGDKNIDRSEFMRVLLDIGNMYVVSVPKDKMGEEVPGKSKTFSSFMIEKAVKLDDYSDDDVMLAVEGQGGRSDSSLYTAEPGPSEYAPAHVEICECDPGYEGLHCQYCARGFTRSDPNDKTSDCIRCFCNDRSDTCDRTTGKCRDCANGYTGDRCERCPNRFYENIAEQKCEVCRCPMEDQQQTISAEDFCVTAENERDYICNYCRPGYSGRHCEVCDHGYYGDPLNNDPCRMCSCDPEGSVEGSTCNSVGECVCKDGYQGHRCSDCLEKHVVMTGPFTSGVCKNCDTWCINTLLESIKSANTPQVKLLTSYTSVKVIEDVKINLMGVLQNSYTSKISEFTSQVDDISDKLTAATYRLYDIRSNILTTREEYEDLMYVDEAVKNEACVRMENRHVVMYEQEEGRFPISLQAFNQVVDNLINQFTEKGLILGNCENSGDQAIVDLAMEKFEQLKANSLEFQVIQDSLANYTFTEVSTEKFDYEINEADINSQREQLNKQEDSLARDFPKVISDISTRDSQTLEILDQCKAIIDQLKTLDNAPVDIGSQDLDRFWQVNNNTLVELNKMQELWRVMNMTVGDIRNNQKYYRSMQLSKKKSSDIENTDSVGLHSKVEADYSEDYSEKKSKSAEEDDYEAIHSKPDSDWLYGKGYDAPEYLGGENVLFDDYPEALLYGEEDYTADENGFVYQGPDLSRNRRSKRRPKRYSRDTSDDIENVKLAAQELVEYRSTWTDLLSTGESAETSENSGKLITYMQNLMNAGGFLQDAKTQAENATMVKDQAYDIYFSRNNDKLNETVLFLDTKGKLSREFIARGSETGIAEADSEIGHGLKIQEKLIEFEKSVKIFGSEIVGNSAEVDNLSNGYQIPETEIQTESVESMAEEASVEIAGVKDFIVEHHEKLKKMKFDLELKDYTSVTDLKTRVSGELGGYPEVAEKVTGLKTSVESAEEFMKENLSEVISLKELEKEIAEILADSEDILSVLPTGLRESGIYGPVKVDETCGYRQYSIKTDGIIPKHGNTITVKFTPSSELTNGVLMFLKGEKQEFIALEMRAAEVYLMWQLGSDSRSQVLKVENIRAGTINVAKIIRTSDKMHLELNGASSPIREMAGNEVFSFNHETDFLYVGGLPDDIKPEMIKYGNFDGCISQVLINKIMIGLDQPMNFGAESKCSCHTCVSCDAVNEILQKISPTKPPTTKTPTTEITTPFVTEPSETAFSLGYNSYAVMPLPKNTRSNDILSVQLSMRTLIEEGCIFYVNSESSDHFFTAYMKTGLIHFHYEHGENSIMLPTKEKYNTNTDVVIVFELEQSTGETTLEVRAENGDQIEFTKKTFGGSSLVMFQDKMNVGTVSNVLPRYNGPTESTSACISELIFNGFTINPIKNSKDGEKYQISEECNSPIHSASFNDIGHIKIPQFSIGVGEQFEMTLINKKINGPIFYGYTMSDNQWISLLIRIVYRRVQVIFTVGNVHRHDNAFKATRLNHEIKIKVKRTTDQNLRVIINDRQTLEIVSREWRKGNDPFVFENVYLGGIIKDNEVTEREKVHRPQVRVKSFRGCIQKMLINNSPQDFNQALAVVGQVRFTKCQSKNTLKRATRDGITTSFNKRRQEQFFGQPQALVTSVSKPELQETCRATAYKYSLNPEAIQFGWRPDSYVVKHLTRNHQRSLAKRFRIKLQVKTLSRSGVLIYATPVDENKDSDVRVSLTNGQVQVSIINARANERLTLTSNKRINDGRWHEVTVQEQRGSSKLMLRIDGKRAAIERNVLMMKIFRFPDVVYFGGRPGASWYTAERYRSPDACMRNVYIGRSKTTISNPASCNFVTGCGMRHEPGMFFPGTGNHTVIKNSYGEIANAFGKNGELKLTLNFRTVERSGTLIDTKNQNVKVKIIDGEVRIISGDKVYSSNKLVCDGSWHELEIDVKPRIGRFVFTLDKRFRITKSRRVYSAHVLGKAATWSKGSFDPSSVADEVLYVGGYFDYDSEQVQSNFRGCMKGFEILSSKKWRWSVQKMLTTKSCPVPEF